VRACVSVLSLLCDGRLHFRSRARSRDQCWVTTRCVAYVTLSVIRRTHCAALITDRNRRNQTGSTEDKWIEVVRLGQFYDIILIGRELLR